ncbi:MULTISPECIES: hypothetical protein [unclassified Nocardiopsis]|uniref:hypothetical protein n=1 Tax=unclassified Nocardiopsis TaxID=2649073 RepID=UPI00066E2AE6|nr:MULTISPECIES: hypothetical protein [unclassified Nocardiopsis]MBQ1084615.1 DUF4190 domain-containing protein [Nocardiopsis sp. B62]PWV44800.1 hypothetical protein BDW27_12126 [Nocardiopsis sp. L17-MgMaSL7]
MTDNSPEPRADGQPPRVERGGLWGLFLGLAGLLFPPYGAVLSVFGVVQGFRARRAARSNGTQAPGALMSVGLGVVGIVVSAAMVSVLFVYQEQASEYRDCSARSHTVSTQKACDEAWESGTGLPPVIVGG